MSSLVIRDSGVMANRKQTTRSGNQPTYESSALSPAVRAIPGRRTRDLLCPLVVSLFFDFVSWITFRHLAI